MPKKRSGKLRAAFRKNHQGRVRRSDLTREFRQGDADQIDDAIQSERLSGKGDLTRKRTVAGTDETSDSADGLQVDLSGDTSKLLQGRVLSVHGLQTKVLGDDGLLYSCAIRQLLKSLSMDQRNVVVAGDRVWFRKESRHLAVDSETVVDADRPVADGMIEQVQTRHGLISRTSRGRQHILAANIDAILIIASVAQPGIKPALIDRMLLTAHQCRIEPVIVLNKIDLIDPLEVQQLIGVYASLGYRVLPTSAETGQNIEYLRAFLRSRQTALAGQSGVGKSSLLNVIEPGLGLAVGRVSTDNDKGRHTTTAARLIPLQAGGAVFDTPGIRQFQLWDIEPSEVAGLMPDLRPYVSACRYPNCLHLSEDECAVKDAVADARIDARRYDAYCHLLEGDLL